MANKTKQKKTSERKRDAMEASFTRIFFTVVIAINLNGTSIVGGMMTELDQNVGTVLFERSDCGKHCWTSEEFTILNSRRMFQDILPKVDVIDCHDDQYIASLMEYFHICLESVRKLSIGKTKHLMLKALADTMGGYLRVYILPLTRHSYYAGNLKYRNAKRLFELFDELKNFLRTNGIGWMKPTTEWPSVVIPPIVIAPPKDSMSCNGLVTYPDYRSSRPSEHAHDDDEAGEEHQMERRRYNWHRRTRRQERRSDGEEFESIGSVSIPLPFLDDEITPNRYDAIVSGIVWEYFTRTFSPGVVSIALPFAKEHLQSLYGERSAFAVVKYYAASVKCIVSRSGTKQPLDNFNKDMYEWLQLSVNPHLEDERWYPAFGGVLRVMSSLRESGLEAVDSAPGASDHDQSNPKQHGTVASGGSDPEAQPHSKEKTSADADNAVTFGSTELILIALSGALLVWLLVGLILVCYRFLARNSDDCPTCESASSIPTALLYDRTEYCVPNGPKKIVKKSFGEKLGLWWKHKFGQCPGGCRSEADEERCIAAMSYSSKDTIDVTNSSKSSR